MNQFETAAVVEDTVWALRLADYPRSMNRTRINDLFNGEQPYPPEEAEKNGISINVNFLESTMMAHDARRQYANAFTKPGNFFKVDVDRGPAHKRKLYSATITREINKRMKKSLGYFEAYRSQFANVVLHGIGPLVWSDRESWEPDPKGVEDILIPGGTTLPLKKLPFYAVFQPYTAYQLRKLTSGPKVDPAWNMPLVNRLIKDAEKQVLDFGIPNSEVFSPEKMAERMKSDGGFVSGDTVPTIDAWEFYFWNDENKQAGWNKRIVLDANWQGGIGVSNMTRKDIASATSKIGSRDEFLYNPGKRKYASKLTELAAFQFGDLSAVAPFRYHSIRSLGFILFGVCHVLSRVQCAFYDSVFEQLCQYFRVKSLDELERTLKINLFNRAFIDDTVQFISAQERWQVNAPLIQMGMANLKETIGRNSASYTQDFDYGKEKTEKTATQVMAQVQATASLVGAALSQSYEYKKGEYNEICRRFCRKNSSDADVRDFRRSVLSQDVPEEVLDVACWNIEPERVMGAGNKTLEVTIAEKLMGVLPRLDPEPQREVTRDYVTALTDDSALALRLVPETPVRVTDSVHDAQLAAGTLMMGFRVDVKTGINHIEYVETLLHEMAVKMQQIEQRGAMATQEEIIGLQNMAQNIGEHIQIIAQDENEKGRVKNYGDTLGKLGNVLKGYMQRLQEQQQQAAQQQGGDPELQAKLQAKIIEAQAKAANTRESHAQRTAQRQTQFEMEQERKAQEFEIEQERRANEHAMQMEQQSREHQLEMEKQIHATQVDDQATTITTAGELSRQRLKSAMEPTTTEE